MLDKKNVLLDNTLLDKIIFFVRLNKYLYDRKNIFVRLNRILLDYFEICWTIVSQHEKKIFFQFFYCFLTKF
jgi:hypothetical protein